MKRTLLIISLLAFAFPAAAQLAADPWASNNEKYQKKLEQQKAYSRKTVNFQGQNPANIAMPEFVGEKTTWTKAQGQEMIAPEVNITNMLLLTQHLRNLGYQIPDGWDKAISTAPAKQRKQIMGSLEYIRSSGHPVAVATEGYEKIFERYTGFSVNNLIENSIRLIDAKR